MNIHKPRLSRRHFLLAAGAATTAVVARTAVKDGADPATPQKTSQSSKGYHVTEHVRNYYRTART